MSGKQASKLPLSASATYHPLKITDAQYISSGHFTAVGPVKCTAEGSLAACAISAMHWTIKLWGKGSEPLPGSHKVVLQLCPCDSNPTRAPHPHSAASPTPLCHSYCCDPHTWVPKHKTFSHVWPLSSYLLLPSRTQSSLLAICHKGPWLLGVWTSASLSIERVTVSSFASSCCWI